MNHLELFNAYIKRFGQYPDMRLDDQGLTELLADKTITSLHGVHLSDQEIKAIERSQARRPA